ncbi:M16 family metallopeptidase [Haliangium ochraceum]|uniref:Processing peptidase n=1 Tax=Haliangium ochraceum (strain DSM 14365 / JCM 11303 / SMP-2) TaxID=502025 RepID=D0LI29_HALO1|nr:pitrilysin family protein [Haliangium ochraceum]ACY14858.1 processing peptidase [Haliangium ochraceum DSM 14365]
MRWTLDAEHTLGPRPIQRYVWPNGLRVILGPDPAAPVFSYQTWFRVGSRNERPGQTGMAHFFEHLMFNETETLAPGELDRLIENRGGDNNAATWSDWTFYRTSLPARDLELAVRIESERLQRLVLEETQIEAEREVIVNERLENVDDDVDGFLDERLYELAFTTHPYRWPTIGWMDDIRSMNKAEIRAFYDAYYTPGSATIVLVGDIDTEAALALIDRYYGDIPAGAIPPEPSAAEPVQTGERRAHFAKPVHAERMLIGYKIPGQSHPDWPVLQFISSLLSGGPSARLYRRLVVDTQMATSLDCAPMPFRDPNLFRIAVHMARDCSAAAAQTEVDAILAQLAHTPVPTRELDKVKNCVETDFWSELDDCDGRAEALGHFETTLGDFRNLFNMAARLAAITADDIQRVAATYFLPEQRSVVIAEPDSDDDDEAADDSGATEGVA